ncbi:MAG: acetoin utilization protein AcuC [Proteobacteria bacterium]|nr:acetoin utilization protein AcuC [Pseudomonadota bacterium]
MARVQLYVGEALGRYGFPQGHPFGTDRQQAFWDEAQRLGLDARAVVCAPVQATREQLERFHTPAYVERVAQLSARGAGLLDAGDTPAFPGCYEAAAAVVGSVLDALDALVAGRARRAFVPIAGLHHARRDRAGGFCVFNDCGVAIATARARYGLRRVAYVDLDAHHGDGVYYEFEDDPELCIADLHEDGRFLYPGTGAASETGRGAARGTKLNLPLPPGAGPSAFAAAWARAEAFLEAARPELVLLQCGADSLSGDPLAHLDFSPACHAQATRALIALAERHAEGRLLVTGGGGYNRANLAAGWTAVLEALLSA